MPTYNLRFPGRNHNMSELRTDLNFEALHSAAAFFNSYNNRYLPPLTQVLLYIYSLLQWLIVITSKGESVRLDLLFRARRHYLVHHNSQMTVWWYTMLVESYDVRKLHDSLQKHEWGRELTRVYKQKRCGGRYRKSGAVVPTPIFETLAAATVITQQ